MWKIRAALPEDRDAVEAVWNSSGLSEANDEEWYALTAGPSTMLLVADDDGRIAGTAVASFDGWRAFIYHVAVTPEMRGKGVARALMAEAEAQLRRQGARRAYALVNETKTAGLALCAARGFEPEGDIVFVKEFGQEMQARPQLAEVSS